MVGCKFVYLLVIISFFSFGCVNMVNKKVLESSVEADSVLLKNSVVFELKNGVDGVKSIGTRSLGNAKSGEILNDSFSILNASDEIVIILEAKTNCGCVELSYDKKPMKKTEKNLIKYSYDTKGKTGVQLSEIAIKTNIGTYTVLVDLNIE